MKQLSFIRALAPLILLMMCSVSGAHAADRFYIEPVEISPGETNALVFNLENGQELFGFQADLKLPDGLEFVSVNNQADITLSSRFDRSYTVISKINNDGTLRFGTFSTTHTAIKENDGTLLTTNVKADDNFIGGEIYMSGIMFINNQNKDVELPDFSLMAEVSQPGNFYIPDFTIAVGQTKTIGAVLDNKTEFSAFQTDIYLPEGLKVVDDSFKLSGRATDGHSLTTRTGTDGRIRVICYSFSSDVFSGNEGALLEFDVTAESNITENSTIELKNLVFSTAAAKEYSLPETVTSISSFNAPVESIILDKTSISLKVGDIINLTATIYPDYAFNKGINWTIANNDIAKIDETGAVTAFSIGTTTVNATAADDSGVTALCEVTVVPTPVSGISLNVETASLKVGESVELTATVSPGDATDKTVVWSSDNDAIAVVDANGKVTAIAIGEAVITAKAGEPTASCKITVVPTPVSGISLNTEAVSLKVGESVELTATVSPGDATDKTVVWSSDNEAVAIVDANGKVTAIAIGEAIITAKAGNFSISCKVTVIPILAESIKVTPTEYKCIEGDSISLIVEVLPDNTTNKSVAWCSSDENIAIVDETGFVNVRKPGTCVITATTTDGSNLKDECVIVGTSGISAIFADKEVLIDVYTITGVAVKLNCTSDDLSDLEDGFYVIRQGRRTKTVYISSPR